jgi:hypothetical protein
VEDEDGAERQSRCYGLDLALTFAVWVPLRKRYRTVVWSFHREPELMSAIYHLGYKRNGQHGTLPRKVTITGEGGQLLFGGSSLEEPTNAFLSNAVESPLASDPRE